MNKLRSKLTRKRMLFTLIGAFTTLLVITLIINIAFYYQESRRQSALARSFLVSSFQTSLDRYDTLMSSIKQDTELLFQMPGLDSFSAVGSLEEQDLSYLQTYAQSRYAFDGIAYYQEDTQDLVGFRETRLWLHSTEAAQDALSLSDEAWAYLLSGDRFVFTNETEPHVVVSTRIGEQVICLRTISWETTVQLLQFISGESQASQLFPAWSVSITDGVGQRLQCGTPDIQGIQKDFSMPDSTGFHLTLQISDQVDPAVWRYVTQTLLYYGSALLILGFLFIDIAVSKLYRPVQLALDCLPGNLSHINGSEHECLQQAIRALDDRQAITQIRMQELLRQSFLQRAMIGSVTDCGNLDALLDQYQLTGCFDRFAVFCIRSESGFVNTDAVNISQISADAFQVCTIIQQPHALWLLVSSLCDGDFHAFDKTMCRRIKQIWRMDCRIFRSNIHGDFSESTDAYIECSIAAEAKHGISGGESVICYGMIPGNWPKALDRTPVNALEQQILQAAASHHTPEALDLLQQYKQLLCMCPLSTQLQKVLAVSLCVRLALSVSAEKLPLSEAGLVHLLFRQIPEDVFWVSVKRFCSDLLASRQPSYPDHFEMLIRYVQENLSRTSLCATEVASAFSISVSSLTREFQKNLGMGFSNYLHIQRIQKAKTLLQATAKPIKEIAAEVGYSNTLTMTRAFKKYEGTTPGAYRTTQAEI